MRAEIISVGTELLLGDIVNTNARFLSQELAALGYTVYYQTVVGDNAVRLRSLLQEAKARSEVLVLTGGLGPTEDDLTKETVAEVFGDRLVLDHDELARIEAYFKARGRPMSDNNRKQAMVPRGGRKLPNPNGTAPGAFFRQGGKYAFLLPGPPGEMEPMFEAEVRPILESMQDSAIRSLVLRVVGIGESDLETKVALLLEGENPTAALYAKTGEVHIRITAKAESADQADVMCTEYAQLFRKVLGDLIYSDNGEDLETTVVHALMAHDETIATAESCTGGLLSERITSVSGASGVFGFGAVTYANEVKHELVGVANRTLRRYGAVSSQVAAEMAYGAARRGATDYGVGITGIAGPDGGTEEKPVGLVYIAVAAGNQVFIRKMMMKGRSREVVRRMATQHALDMVRLLVAEKPVPEAKSFTKGQQPDFERVGKPRHKAGAAGRVIGAVLLVLAVLALIFGALYLSRGTGAEMQDIEYPSTRGLRYGTPEYTAAAEDLVAQAAAENPAVVGFVALPYPQVEGLVAQVSAAQAELPAAGGHADEKGMARVASAALPARTAANTVVLGGESFAPLLALAASEDAQQLSTFSYFTSREEKVYEIFAVYLIDESEVQPDGFDPAAGSLAAYENYLTFALGAKMRSLYEVGAALAPQDSFVSLAVADPATEGRTLYVCGRLLPAGETTAVLPPVQTAGAPLMPAAYYRQHARAMPDTAALYEQWLRWYMTRNTTNEQLQYQAGMPATDGAPVEVLEPEGDPADEGQPAASTAGSSAASGVTSSGVSPAASASTSSAAATAAAQVTAQTSGSTPASSSGAASSGGAAYGATSGTSEGAQEDEPDQPQSTADSEPETPDTPQTRRPDPGSLTVTLNGVRTTGLTADILAQICQREAGVTSPEAVKALAIAAHSWILNQQAAGIPAPAVMGMPPSAEVRSAVAEVAHVILSADGAAPAFTPFYAMAAQGGNNPEDVWGASRPYLGTVPARYDQGEAGWRTILTFTSEEVAALLAAALGPPQDTGWQPESWFADIQKNKGGYVTALQVMGNEMTGAQFWQQVFVRDGVPLLPSSAFEMEYNGNEFIFTCYGQGHGCGMSLAGAEGMARAGRGYEAILAYYFGETERIAWE